MATSRQFSPLRGEDARRVEVGLRGGLGNQLFGFAVGLDLARRLELPLHLVTQVYDSGADAKRQFSLEQVASGSASWGARSLSSRVFSEQSFAYDSRYEALAKPVFLDGYFQSPRYFESSSNELKSRISGALSFGAGAAVANDQEFIGLQVRRGDYLNPGQRNFHGIVPFAFFVRAVAILRQTVGQLPVRVFSDDEDTASELASAVENAEPHRSPDRDPLSILGELSGAKALAISNSSFGWWAAYLSACNTPVIAPRPWFRDRSVDTSDLLEPEWLTLGFRS